MTLFDVSPFLPRPFGTCIDQYVHLETIQKYLPFREEATACISSALGAIRRLHTEMKSVNPNQIYNVVEALLIFAAPDMRSTGRKGSGPR